MENFREFQVADPFGKTWTAQFKYLQTGISIRHSDSVDVCYILTSGEETLRKTVVLKHPELRDYTSRTGRKISDPWCSRLAVLKLQQVIGNGEDPESQYLAVSPVELKEYDEVIQEWEKEWLKEHAA